MWLCDNNGNSYIHTITMALVRIMECIYLVILMKRWWCLQRYDGMRKELCTGLMRIMIKFAIITEIWIMMAIAIKLITYITLINIQSWNIYIDTQKSTQAIIDIRYNDRWLINAVINFNKIYNELTLDVSLKLLQYYTKLSIFFECMNNMEMWTSL